MINGIAGKPGGGKSYEAVKNHVIPAIKEGRRVVTNLPLQIEHFVAVFGEQVRDLIVLVKYDFHDYGNQKPFSRIEDWLDHKDWKNEKGQGVLFAIDEAHLSLPNGKGSNEFTKVLEFLSMHRHYGFDVILITQNFKKVHRDIRDMIQLVYRCIKKSMFGQDDQYIIKVHEGCTSQVVNTDEREYESFVFKFYKSHTKSDKQIVEATTRDVTPWHKTGLMKAAYFVLFIAFLMLVNLVRVLTVDDEPEPTKPAEQIKELDKKSSNLEFIQVAKPDSVSSQKVPNKPVQTQMATYESQQRLTDYQRMVDNSEKYHPFHKVGLSVSGYAEDIDFKIYYFSAQQNGQHVFTVTSKDLLLAGYDMQILSPCVIILRFYKYEEYITCNRQTIGVGGEAANQIAMNN